MAKAINKVSKSINDSSANVFKQCVRVITALGFTIDTVDSSNGTITYWSHTHIGHIMQFKYQCNVINMGADSTLCTIQTVDYFGKGIATEWADSIGLFMNSKKNSIKVLESI